MKCRRWQFQKIQTTIVNTIPLWKNQMVLALGMAHSQQAMQAERAVTDATNELLRKNAATLKQGTIDIAKESERGIVDIETLRQTNSLVRMVGIHSLILPIATTSPVAVTTVHVVLLSEF